LTLLQSAPGYVTLHWQSTTGEFFSVETASNLAQGFSGVLSSNILATPPANTLTLPATHPTAFYRLRF
jgi:hypothetical protein